MNKVWFQIWFHTKTTISNKKINMTTCLFGLGLLCVCILSLTFSFSFTFFFQHVWTVTVLFMHMDSLCRRQSALFTGPTITLFRKKILKMGSKALFTHLKIIFSTVLSIFCFWQNKLYTNGPYKFCKSTH